MSMDPLVDILKNHRPGEYLEDVYQTVPLNYLGFNAMRGFRDWINGLKRVAKHIDEIKGSNHELHKDLHQTGELDKLFEALWVHLVRMEDDLSLVLFLGGETDNWLVKLLAASLALMAVGVLFSFHSIVTAVVGIVAIVAVWNLAIHRKRMEATQSLNKIVGKQLIHISNVTRTIRTTKSQTKPNVYPTGASNCEIARVWNDFFCQHENLHLREARQQLPTF